ncbi:MAG TPA: YbaK/EbsC family protein [Vicinamibacteria bacterium]|nr:YbaK/EbsC family protein [Vicinamibacteria bacterium]
MTIPRNIKRHLDANDVIYRHLSHPQVFTSAKTAEALDMTGRAYAKTVVVVVDGGLIMAAVPANQRVDVEKLAQMTGASSVRLASEPEFKGSFPSCEVGAMPPLGELFDIPVWLDASFVKQPTIAFDAGTHTDSVEVGLEDFRRLVRPRVARLTEVDESSERKE